MFMVASRAQEQERASMGARSWLLMFKFWNPAGGSICKCSSIQEVSSPASSKSPEYKVHPKKRPTRFPMSFLFTMFLLSCSFGIP